MSGFLGKKLASQSALIFAMRIFGAGLVFLSQAGIARFLGASVLGEYLLFLAAINLTAMVMPLGFQTVGTYFAADYRARGQVGHLRRFLLRAHIHIGVTGFLFFGAGFWLWPHLGAPGAAIAAHWGPATLMAVATALVYVNGALLVGLKHPFAGFAADGFFRPLLIVGSVVLVAVLGEQGGGLSGLLGLISAGFLVIALAQAGLTFFLLGKLPEGRGEAMPRHVPRRWWRFAVPWVIMGLASDFFFDLDLLLLSGALDHDALAIFGVSARIFSLVAFGVSAVYAVTLPDMFEDAARANGAGFAEKVGAANLIAAGLAFVLFVGAGIFGPFVLLLFGTSFLVGAGPLAVLSLALVVRAIFGPAALVLSMTDRPYAGLPAVAVGLLSLLAGNFLLVPMFGLMGAAVSALIAISLWSAGQWWTARRLAKVDVSVFPRLSGLSVKSSQAT